MDVKNFSLQTLELYMGMALEEARKAAALGEVPVGAVIVCDDPAQVPRAVVKRHNNRESERNPVGHAELLAIEEASKQWGRWRLSDCSLYVTLEPCLMCAGAIILSRVDRVIYGAVDPKGGAVASLYQTLADPRLNHRPQVLGGVLEKPCGQILKDFFAKKREQNKIFRS